MAEAKEIPPGEYELKLGSTFETSSSRNRDRDSSKPVYSTLRYDFKPQSVAASDSESYIAFGGNGDVQVAVPTADDGLTVYKGSQKPVQKDKECLLFFDHRTGSVRLEKLSSNISVKKTRDIEPSTEQVLRNEIQRLRASGRKGGGGVPRPSSSNAAPSSSSASSSLGAPPPPTLHDASSDSSSSDDNESSGDESDSGSDRATSPPALAQQRNRFSPSTSSSHNNESGSEDELTKALENELTAPPPAPQFPTTSSLFADLDDPVMPPVEKPAPVSKTKTKDLMSDLQLSESSEDDD